MKKFRLDLEDLAIDSFATTYVEREKGTVHGEQVTGPTCDASCDCPSGDNESCNGTCDYSFCGTICLEHTYDYTCVNFPGSFGGWHAECVLCG